MKSVFEEIKWDTSGLVPAIAQQYDTGKVLMVAWMNREALTKTIDEGRAIYYSRSRKKIWRKGEESGHIQVLKELRIDCDSDVVLMQVDQVGGIACHTGRHACFYKQYENGQWVDVEPVLKSEAEIYAGNENAGFDEE
jgi:phosphoribosyl-AMP cyclohydrolase